MTVTDNTDKLGRNSDGTFSTGNQISVGNNGGRPLKDLSIRHQVKLRISKDPDLIQKTLDGMFKILSDYNHPQYIRMLDIFIRINGNFDPIETKDVTTQIPDSPLDNLTIEELRKLKALKSDLKSSKD